MRDYSRVTPQIWIGETGKALRGNIEAQLVALYLITSPLANMLGLYYLPMAFLIHESGLTQEGASKGLGRLCDVGFCAYDEAAEVAWVYGMAHFQIADHLDLKDNRVKGIQNEYERLPKNRFLAAFFDKYALAFHMVNKREPDSVPGSSFQAPSKPLRSQEQELEQEHFKRNCTPATADMPITVSAVAHEEPKAVRSKADVDLADLDLWVDRLSKAWPKSQPDEAPVPYTCPSRIKVAMVKACKRLKATPTELAYCALGYEQAMRRLPKGGPYRVAAQTFLNSMAGDFLAAARAEISALETETITEGGSDEA